MQFWHNMDAGQVIDVLIALGVGTLNALGINTLIAFLVDARQCTR